jgi:uncharacterized protein
VLGPPHPLYGGTLHDPVLAAAGAVLAEGGLATLALNYRGVQGSEGEPTDDPAAAVTDYTAALDALADRVPGPYLAAGYSFGAATALAVAAREDRVGAAVLVAPPVHLARAEHLDRVGGPVLVVVGDHDAFAPLPDLRAWLGDRAAVTLEVIPGADHFFSAGRAAVTDAVRRWLP